MNANIIRKRLIAMLFSLLLFISCMTGTAFAYLNIDTERATSLTVYFEENGKGFSEVNFRIYRVADMNKTGKFTLSGDFQSYPVSLENLDSAQWRALTQTLDAYVKRDKLQPQQTGKTDIDGAVAFSKLTVGLYLVTGDAYIEEGIKYTPEPMLVTLPGLFAEEWSYDMKVYSKYGSASIPHFVELKVQKVWKDAGNQDKRPQSISVQLLENGIIADTVTLNRENNWEYTWTNLNGSSEWLVTEAEIPDGYTVTVAKESRVFIITNTYPMNEPPKLPQTGALWWPVPLLICGGLLLTSVGFFVLRRWRDSHEK